MLLSATPANEADSLLLMLWEGILPWWFPITFLVLLVAFRGLWAEMFAEAAFIYRRRLDALERGARERRRFRKFLRTLWADLCAWRASLDAGESAAAERDAAVARLARDLRLARPFAPADASERLADWERRCAAAAGAPAGEAATAQARLATELEAEFPLFMN